MKNTDSEKSLSDLRKEMRIKWYRCPIEAKELRELSTRSDAKGYQLALGHLGIWLTTGTLTFLFANAGWWFAALILLFAHGTVGTFFIAPWHELTHGTVFQTKKLNTFFLRIFSLLGWLSFPVYQVSHNYHHRFTLHSAVDKELVLPKVPSLKPLYLLQLFTFNFSGGFESRGLIPTLKGFWGMATDRFNHPYFSNWDVHLFDDAPVGRQHSVRWARLVLGFHTGVLIFALLIGQPILFFIISLHHFIGNWLWYFVGAPMHCGLRSDVPDFRKCVRTITLDPISEFLYWHMNWHFEHHMFAAVPCYNFQKLNQAVSDDMPKPRTMFGAWKEMRETYRKQLEHPTYEFDTPVPVSKKEKFEREEQLEAALGTESLEMVH
ncbi:MAG: fatty acid desaturase [bacterium]